MTMPILEKVRCGCRFGARRKSVSSPAPECAGRVAGIARNAGLLESNRCQPAWQSMAVVVEGELAQLALLRYPPNATFQSAAFAGGASDGRPMPPRVKIASI